MQGIPERRSRGALCEVSALSAFVLIAKCPFHPPMFDPPGLAANLAFLPRRMRPAETP